MNENREDISKYGLYLTEDNGEVDTGFPCLDPSENIGKFDFSVLGLLEMKPSDLARQETIKTMPDMFSSKLRQQQQEEDDELAVVEEKTAQKLAQDMAKMEVHTNAMEAPRYQLYRLLSPFNFPFFLYIIKGLLCYFIKVAVRI